ncbi:MAG: ComEC/Rec2 family competence protein [Bacilli bacterium]
MNKFFLFFLSILSGILIFNTNYFYYGIVFLVLSIFFIVKKYRKSKIIIIISIVLFCYGVFRSNYHFNTLQSDYFYGFVIEKKENYCILFDGVERIYINTKNLNIKLYDVVKIKGNFTSISFVTLESGFNFEEYLNNKGIQNQIEISELTNIFSFPFDIFAYKQNIINKFSNENAKFLASSLLFGEGDNEANIYSSIKILNLFVLFSYTGIYLNFLLYGLAKLLSLKFSKKNSRIMSFLFLLPFLFININKFVTIKVIAFYLFSFINTFKYKSFFEKIEKISMIGLLFLIYNPFLLYQKSFHISFLIMFINCFLGLYYLKYKGFKLRIIKNIINILLLVPFMIEINHSINIVSFILTFLLLPLTKGFICLLLLYLLGLSIKYFEDLLILFSKVIIKLENSYLQINVPTLNPILIILYYSILIFIFYFLEINHKKYYKKGILITTFALILYSFPIKNMVTFEVDYINVGQGDSSLIRYQQNTMLIDTGGLIYNDVAINNLIPYFKKKRIYEINTLFITHDDYDHNGALDSLNEHFKINNIVDENDDFPYYFNGIKIENLNQDFNEDAEENEKSLVLRFTIKNITFLFMGDAPIEVEKNIINNGYDITADYLKVGHHGSNTSSSEDFISKTNAKEAIISCGLNNKFHHPHKEVLDVLNKNEIKIRRTDLEGTIEYIFYV